MQGITEMDAAPIARRFRRLAADERLRIPLPERVRAAAPAPYVLAARGERVFMDGGSALRAADREEIARRLPADHVVGIEGGHCLHRDAPDDWLAAVRSIVAR